MEDVKYEDGEYEVGYKKAVFEVKYKLKDDSKGGTTPAKPDTPTEEKPEDKKPEEKNQKKENVKAIIDVPSVSTSEATNTEEAFEGLIFSAGLGTGRDTAVLPGMIPMKSQGRSAELPDTAVDPGFIAGQALSLNATQVAGASLPKTGEGMTIESYILLFLALGIISMGYGFVLKRKKYR